MKERYWKEENELLTSAQAVAFIGCQHGEPLAGRVTYGCAAFVFSGEKFSILQQKIQKPTPYGEVMALFDALELVLEYCGENQLYSIDIFYDSDEKLLDIWGENQDELLHANVRQRVHHMEKEYGNLDGKLYRIAVDEKISLQLITNIAVGAGHRWMQEQNAQTVYLVIVKEYADALLEGEETIREVKTYLDRTVWEYKVKTGVSSAEANGEDDYDWVEVIEEDEEYPFEEPEEEEDSEVSTEEMSQEGDVSGEEKAEDILELVFQYAKSIKKKSMTPFHLLYGMACVALLGTEDIRKKVNTPDDIFDAKRIDYFREKLLLIFHMDGVEIDPLKIKKIMPQYIAELEENSLLEEEYDEVCKRINTQKTQKELREVIVCDALKFIIARADERRAAYQYFRMNKRFSMELSDAPEKKKEQQIPDSMESIVKKSNELYKGLIEKIYGQDLAVQKFVQGYINSMMDGANKKNRPAASFLFAGPPGVGKTYLARLSSEILDMPFLMLNMSEYVDSNAVYGLVGFEKTWKASVPGRLTTFISENPKSVVLVDEIEKAHEAVQMLFLQVLEGARLHDKYYDRDVNFEDVIIIFTTNCGKNLYELNEGVNLSTLEETEVQASLREDEAFPNELCSRFASGNMIVFNHLQPHHLIGIVKNKLENSKKEIAESFGVQMEYHKLLPELFLFHVGSGADARVVSSKSEKILKESLLGFAKEQIEKRGHLEAKEIFVDIRLEKEEKEVYSLFVEQERQKILVISESPDTKWEHPAAEFLFAKNAEEMEEIIHNNKLSLALIDLKFKEREDCTGVSNALGVESEGKKCFVAFREMAPLVPVYIMEHSTYGAKDEMELANHGVRGFFAEGSSKEGCRKNLEALLNELHMQKNLKLLQQKGQMVYYETRFVQQDGHGVVELYRLSLKNVGVDDAALRRKALQSKVFDFERPTLRFSDIIGAEQAKREFKHFISYIRNIDKYVAAGIEAPKGVILYGPPGTGKTSLAKALAGECDALFLNTTGAGIRNAENPVQEIRDLFKIAYAKAPAILFIDEIDVIAKERTGYDTTSELLVNTLLTEMEGFRDRDPHKPVLVVAATNYGIEHKDRDRRDVVLDPALVRRFDNPVYVGLPDRKERWRYLEILLEEKKYKDRISEAAIDYAAEHTGGRSFAFLKRAIKNMANRVVDEGLEVNDDLLTDTLETQIYGQKRKSDEEYRLSVARHEAGHAYVAWKTKRTPKFITIVSRGNFGGYVSYGDGEEVHNWTREQYLGSICQALAGRAAEMVYYGEAGVNTGASSDLQTATSYAMNMLSNMGMGNMGLVSIKPEYILETQKGAELLEEANKILEEQMERAIRYIRQGRGAIDKIVDVLMDKSYIQGENLIAVLEESEQAIELQEETETAEKKQPGRKHKWYVVINGRMPGIYTSWEECRRQVDGYSNAVYRSYENEEEANRAFRSARIGVKDIREKNLLYCLVKLEDFRARGLESMRSGDGRLVCYDFHAYTKKAQKLQEKSEKGAYIYICISREMASRRGYKIYIKNTGEKDFAQYSYEDGFGRIDWDAMEHLAQGENETQTVMCMAEGLPSAEEIQYIYTFDERTADSVTKCCKEKQELEGKKISVVVNRRMFI